MNEYILFRALFFVAMILLAAVIVTVVAFGSSLISPKKIKRHKKAKKARKRIHVVSSNIERNEKLLPASTTITIDNCWFHRI